MYQNSPMVLIFPLPQTPRSLSDAATQLQNPEHAKTQRSVWIKKHLMSTTLCVVANGLMKLGLNKNTKQALRCNLSCHLFRIHQGSKVNRSLYKQVLAGQ